MEASKSTTMQKFDPLTEEPLPINVPRAIGAKVSTRTLYRYVTKGCLNKHTSRHVVLESAYVGNQLCTSRESWGRFLRRLNETE